tara:strand:+ start:45958 stop:47028 length:1071 start_codon:yes stop_codon:yes gene_type:complete
MRAAIIGVGNMGQAVAWSMDELGFDLTLVDSSEKALEECNQLLQKPANLQHSYTLGLGNPDVVISCLPYSENTLLAQYCIKNRLRYCDLGGNVKISEDINEFASRSAKAPIMTDLGLAPGFVNIVLEEFFRQASEAEDQLKTPENVNVMVGGIPQSRVPSDYFNYNCTWSVDGLINEYTEDCILVQNGVKIVSPPLLGLVKLMTKNLGELEAFYTSGGSAHSVNRMIELGVSNFSYRTLRWPGHHWTINLLINKCDLNKDQLKHIFTKNCSTPTNDDCVAIYMSVDDKIQEMVIYPQRGFTAMQVGTGYSAAVVASLLARGDFDDKKTVKYEDINFETFTEVLDKLVSTENDNELQ